MTALIRASHLIPILILLTTRFLFSSANQLQNKDAVGCTYSDDGTCQHQHATGGPIDVTGSVCFTCASPNVNALVIGLPGISMPGLSISLPTISIGTSGIQVGGGGTVGYYAVCCIPVGYGYGYGYGRPLIPIPQEGVDKDSHPKPNPHPAQSQGSKGGNEDKHVVKPKMETRKLGRKYYMKGDENVVKATMDMGKQSNGNEHGDDSRVNALPPR